MDGSLPKKIARRITSSLLVFFLILAGCGKEENINSAISLLLADAPIDAQDVKSVNIVIADVSWKKGADPWKSLLYLDRPINVDMLSLPEGEGVLLLTKYVESGTYSAFRLTLQLAERGSSLMLNPLSNVVFANDSARYLYWFNDQPTEVIIETDIVIPTRRFMRFIIDFNLRKSIRLTSAGEYILEPVARLLNTDQMGFIEAIVYNPPEEHRILVYAYKQGVFSESEMKASDETVAFKNSITSAVLKENDRLLIPFLEPGEYELIFVEYAETGYETKILKREPNIQVTTEEQPDILKIDLG